ncbi:hypothetical protein ACJJTC_012219 [Scirpophaga incertulas]
MIRELSAELAEIAKEQLNENPKQIQSDLIQIKEWIYKQPHLKARTDDQWLVALLRAGKFSLEKLKRKLELYYTLRATAPEITLRLKPTEQEFVDFLKLGTCIILPKAETGISPRVILIRPGAYDPSVHSVADVICILYYLVQILVVEDDIASIIGTKIVIDYEGVTMAHVMQANPSLLKKMVAVTQDSMPLRLRGSHHINLPTGIEVIFSLVSGFLNEKAKQRLIIHKSVEELADFIPKDIIPVEYGGIGSSVANIIGYWVSKMREYKSWMQYEEKLGVDESKRINMTTHSASEIEGSFRKLDID